MSSSFNSAIHASTMLSALWHSPSPIIPVGTLIDDQEENIPYGIAVEEDCSLNRALRLSSQRLSAIPSPLGRPSGPPLTAPCDPSQFRVNDSAKKERNSLLDSKEGSHRAILSPLCIRAINRLKPESFKSYHPWQASQDPITEVIYKITTELDEFFPFEKFGDSYLGWFSVIEQAIQEIHDQSQLSPDQTELLEIGVRERLFLHNLLHSQIWLDDALTAEKDVSKFIYETLPPYLYRLITRDSYYVASPSYQRLLARPELLSEQFLSHVEDCFKKNLSRYLVISNQIKLCSRILEKSLEHFKSCQWLHATLEFTGRLKMIELIIEKNAPPIRHYIEKQCKNPAAGSNAGLILKDLLVEPLFAFFSASFEKTDSSEQIERNGSVVDEGFATIRNNIEARYEKKKRGIEENSAKPFSSFLSKLPFIDHRGALKRLEEAKADELCLLELIELGIDPSGLEIILPHATKPLPDEGLSLEADPLPISAPPLDSEKKTRSILPLTSYAHFAFGGIIADVVSKQKNPQMNLYDQFSPAVQRDMVRHLYYLNLKCPIEKRVEKAFSQKVGVSQLNAYYIKELNRLDKKLTTAAPHVGEEILKLYYSGKEHELLSAKLQEFVPDERFAQLLIALTQAVFTPTDHEDELADRQLQVSDPRKWTSMHYREPRYLDLAMQALEYYLHVGPSEDMTQNEVTDAEETQ
jgi:hypothetical protein